MKTRLGIIGTGIAARELHLPALNRMKDKFEIVCVCNHTEPKAKEFAELVGGVPYFLDYHELLARPDVEAVDIILPIELNLQVTRDALEAGKHVIVEKPIAANIPDAQAMVALAGKYDRVIMMAENYRYNPVFLTAKKMMDERMIGQPYSVFWSSFGRLDPANKYARTAWRINHKYPGGFVTDAGIHNIAVLRDLFGDFKSGISFTRSTNPAIGKMDSMSFQFIFKSGVSGVFNMYFSANGLDENRLLILGDKGALDIRRNIQLVLKREGKDNVEEKFDTDGGYFEEFEDFYDALANGKKPVATFEESYKDFRSMVSALESASRWAELGLED